MLAVITKLVARLGYDLFWFPSKNLNDDWHCWSIEDSNKGDGIILLGYSVIMLITVTMLAKFRKQTNHFVRWEPTML